MNKATRRHARNWHLPNRAVNPYPLLCAVTQEPGHGGIARVSKLLWHVLQEASGMQCRLITLIPEGLEPPRLIDKLRFVKTIVGGLICRNIDWFIFDHLSLGRVQRFVPKTFRRPYGLFLYSVESWSPLSSGLKEILRQARVRIAISNYTAKRVAAAHPDIGPIEVCHLAALPNVNLDRSFSTNSQPFTSLDLDISLLDRIRRNSVLIVGRMYSGERHKGHDQLIECWPLLKARVSDAQLVIVGRGDDVELLKAKANRTGFGESILFTGQVNESTLDAIYQRAAVFAMPSRGEGFGLVYLEAMQHCLPCIGSIHDAAAEIIEDGVTGVLVDQSDSNGLVNAMAGLLENPSRRKEMGDAGFERLQKMFSFEQFKERILTVLRPLMNEELAFL